jgi:hypothetical protein
MTGTSAVRGGQQPTRQPYPIRFVLPVREPDGSRAWRIFVRQGDAQPTLALAAAGNLFTEETVRGWFQQFASRWPEPCAGDLMAAFVLALNVLRVSRSKSVAALQNRTPKHAERAGRMAKIRGAIDTLVHDLPPMLEAVTAKSSIPYTDDEVGRLVMLVQAAKTAGGIIVAPQPQRKETPWHETAQLIEWHLHQLLAPLGVSAGSDSKGPLAKIVKAAIATVEDLHVSEAAVAKALQRAASTSVILEPRERVESRGYAAVG